MNDRREDSVNAGVAYSGDSFLPTDYNDSFLLSLLSEEIQDDQISVIVEGLHLQKTLLSSWMVDEDSGDNKSPEEVKCFSKICQLCVIQEEKIEMIRVSRCGHYFCYKCLNEYVAMKIDYGEEVNCSIKCPAENCSYLMEYDYCVSLMLQCTLDKKSEKLNIS